MQPDISLVVPAYNERVLLPRLLNSVSVARSRFQQTGGEVEVIVADNDSTDDTAAIARSQGCIVAQVERRVIAAARNGGAKVASSPILAFVDADCRIHEETFVRIAETMASGTYLAGASGWRLERRSMGLRATEIATRLVMKTLSIDGGVVFCKRSAFAAIGGYNEERDVAEDVQFLRDLGRLARTHGQQIQLGLGAPAILSTRKWDEHGDWHMFFMAYWPLLQRRSFHAIIRDYWYREQP